MSSELKIKYINGNTYEYRLHKMVDRFDPALRKKADPYVFPEDLKEPRFITLSLIETMREHYGVGLAANQVGLDYRVFVMGSTGPDAVGYAFWNPEILEVTGEDRFEEGCLTFPGLYLPITRPATVKIKYQDMGGEVREETFSGLSARIVLHEYDHLEGVVMTDHVSKTVLERASGHVARNLKALKKQQEHETKQSLIAKAVEKLALEEKKKLNPNNLLGSDTNNVLKIKGI